MTPKSVSFDTSTLLFRHLDTPLSTPRHPSFDTRHLFCLIRHRRRSPSTLVDTVSFDTRRHCLIRHPLIRHPSTLPPSTPSLSTLVDTVSVDTASFDTRRHCLPRHPSTQKEDVDGVERGCRRCRKRRIWG